MMQRLRCIHEKIQNRKSVMISVLDFLRTLIRLSVFCVLSMLASLQKSEYSKSVEACLGRKKRLFCNSPFHTLKTMHVKIFFYIRYYLFQRDSPCENIPDLPVPYYVLLQSIPFLFLLQYLLQDSKSEPV